MKKTTLVWMAVSLVFVLGSVDSQAMAPRRAPGNQCVFNSDCSYPLVCKNALCRQECRDDRDCVHGQMCLNEQIDGAIQHVCRNPEMLGLGFATPVIQENLNVVGNDIIGVDIPYTRADLVNYFCFRACSQTQGCLAYTIVRPGVQGPLARCWLKSSNAPQSTNSCCSTGFIP